jgi:hypothetical protein
MTNLVVTHLGGLPELQDSATYTVASDHEGLRFQTGTIKKVDFLVFKWSEISASIGTEEEIKERLTLARVALVGPFAVFFRKKKATKVFFLTVTTASGTGIFEVAKVSQSVMKPLQLLINSHAKKDITQSTPQHNETTVNQSALDPIESLEKLARLLEQGFLTREEFNAKKAEILNI